MKTDCTNYGNRELALWFQNEEPLYNGMRNAVMMGMNFDIFMDYCCVRESFLFTPSQLEGLAELYCDEKMEYNTNPDTF